MHFDAPGPDDPELEARLRAERPRPSDELLQRLSADRPRTRMRGALTVRLALATALTALLAAAAVTAGGGSSPLGAFEEAKQATKGSSNGGGSDKGKGSDPKPNPGDDQYGGKVTICHRGNSKNNKGVTLTLPRQAAESHLRQHKYDTRGPCAAPPPPPKATICHRGNSKNNKGETLSLPAQAADSHLRQHKYDTRGACPKR